MIETANAVKINVDEKLNDSVALAKRLYLDGSIFIYPTDTIYGFGANPFNENAAKKISKLKGRSTKKKNIMLINNIETLLEYIDVSSEKYLDFLLELWPNPVSVVLNLNRKYSKILNANDAAFRIPNHRFCLKLLDEIKMPLISTSVNKADNPPINEPSVIFEEFSNSVETIFYSTKKNYHVASTLIDLTGRSPKILRQGKIKVDDLIYKYFK